MLSRMKTLITFFSLIQACTVTAFAETKPTVELQKLTDRIYVVVDTFYTPENSAVYVGENEVTVLSATWTPETAKLLGEKVKQLTKKPIKYVVDTHFHLDRTGGNPYFKSIGAKIIASKMTSELMQKGWDERVKSAQTDYPGYPVIPLVKPDITFEHKYELEGGKIQVLYLGPSHTADGTVVYFPDEQILFGDCVLKEKLGNLNDANVEEYPRTLEKIKKLKIKKIIAGHWTPVHGPELIDQMLEQLKTAKKTP